MGGKSQPAAPPPPPDYAAAAKQTAAGDLQAAQYAQIANMVNQTTPYGSVTYTPTQFGTSSKETGSLPIYQWTQNVTLSPEQQKMYEQNQAINQTLGDVAQQGVGYVQEALNKPLEAPGQLAMGVSPTAQNMTRQVDIPELQKRIQDPNLLLQDTTNALYKANTQYLDPQFSQQQADLENKLANQGITQGSEAYNRAMLNFGNQRQQAYESARNQAIAGGQQAAQGMFGMNLQGGQFANQAAGQQFGMGQQNAALNNAMQNQLFGQNLSAAQFQNQAVNQALARAQTLQQNPINMLNAVRTGQQMQVAQMPQVAVSAPGQQATTSGPDMLGAANALGNYNMNSYQAQLQAQSAANAASSNMASGIIGGVMGMM